MFDKLRNYSKIIILIVVVAMVVTGALYGIGAFNTSDMSAPMYNIAVVNGTNISQQEYYSILSSQSGLADLTRAQEVPFKYDVLNTIINRELIFQQADKLGIKPKVTDEEVDEYLNVIIENNETTEEELAEDLKNNNSSLKEFKNQIKDILAENSTVQQVQELSYADVTVLEEEIAEQYEEIKLQVIVKSFADDKENAEKSINEALNKINSGADFKEVAEEYTDVSKVDLAMTNRQNNSLPEDIVDKAFSIENNGISDVFEGEYAFYIVRVMDKKLASGEDYEEAKEEIRNDLLSKKQEEAFSNWILNLRAESEVHINDPILNAYQGLANADYDLAVNELEKVMDSEIIAPMTYVYMAQAYNGVEEFDKAQKTYQQAIEAYPEDWELHFNYAMLMSSMDESDQEMVLSLLDDASNYAGEDFMAHYQLYMAYSQLEEEDKAQAEMEKINEIQLKMQEQQKALNQSDENSNIE